jgi:hypothetical protein
MGQSLHDKSVSSMSLWEAILSIVNDKVTIYRYTFDNAGSLKGKVIR